LAFAPGGRSKRWKNEKKKRRKRKLKHDLSHSFSLFKFK
jgi:hypothetical protein